MVRNSLKSVFFLFITLSLLSCSKSGESEKVYSIDWSAVTEDDKLNELVLTNNLVSLSTVNFAKANLVGTWKNESGTLFTFNSESPIMQVEGKTNEGRKVRFFSPIVIEYNGASARMIYMKPISLLPPSANSLKCTKAEIVEVRLARQGRVLYMDRVDMNKTIRLELQ